MKRKSLRYMTLVLVALLELHFTMGMSAAEVRAVGGNDPAGFHRQQPQWDASTEQAAAVSPTLSAERRSSLSQRQHDRYRYEMEPNNTPRYADWTFPDIPAYGRISKSGDLDYWKVKASQEGTLIAVLEDIPPGRHYVLSLYDDQQRILDQSDGRGERQQVEAEGVEQDRWYYIAVTAEGFEYDTKHYYHLDVHVAASKEDSSTIGPDRFEANNRLDDSTAIPYDDRLTQNRLTPNSLTATLHEKDDVDYYTFTLRLASTIEVSLKSAQEKDLILSLLDRRGRVLARSVDQQKKKTLLFHGDPGNYYIKIESIQSASFTAQSYTLTSRIQTIPVILIPGIGGSRLMVTEEGKSKEAWLDIANMPVDRILAVHRRVLPLVPKKPGSTEMVQREPGVTIAPETGDAGFRATAFLSYDSLLKQHTEQFASLAEHLQKIGYVKGISLFAHPYDWRLSNVENAVRLRERVDEALRASGAGQVQLVAHSMGGLLAREMLLSYPAYQPKTRRLIYLGTPFLGAPRAYQAIKFGYDFGIPLIFSPETGRQIAMYAPAVYQLLPSRAYVERQSYLYTMPDLYRPNKGGREALDYESIYNHPAAQLPYAPLVRQGDLLHRKWDQTEIQVSQYSIIGQGHTTLQGYNLFPRSEWHLPLYDSEGDGTVPFHSANHSGANIRKKFYVAETHAKLPVNPRVIQQVIQLLLGVETVQAGMSDSPLSTKPFDYYVIYNRDGTFPEVTIEAGGQRFRTAAMKAASIKQKIPQTDPFEVEFHGNVIVVIPKAGGPQPKIRDAQSGGMKRSARGSQLVVERQHSTTPLSLHDKQ
ncbi:esterase [Brevibacillus humidisoli]|uniref:lipase/acyltransferase domain-containing protein n=1 Tax=Brevibacillus humidisoli TaxID=2895522 RepID=UPI001E2C0A79|nr:esterase [Brevibacillus humidisoli]UFJ40222.1 esterase [Brevibacillus humidisoli]